MLKHNTLLTLTNYEKRMESRIKKKKKKYKIYVWKYFIPYYNVLQYVQPVKYQ